MLRWLSNNLVFIKVRWMIKQISLGKTRLEFIMMKRYLNGNLPLVLANMEWKSHVRDRTLKCLLYHKLILFPHINRQSKMLKQSLIIKVKNFLLQSLLPRRILDRSHLRNSGQFQSQSSKKFLDQAMSHLRRQIQLFYSHLN